MRFSSKRELVQRIETEHEALLALVRSIPRSRYREDGVWGDRWTIHDLLAHLTAWEQMCLGWYEEGRDGGTPVMPAPGYKWNQTPALNRAIWTRHHAKATARVIAEFEASYQQILGLITRLTPEQLLAPGHFAWTETFPLTTYLAPNTCSHYRFATRVLKRWLKTAPGRARRAPKSATRTDTA